jgi:hypothetical protein
VVWLGWISSRDSSKADRANFDGSANAVEMTAG